MLARSSAVSWGVRFAEEVQCRRTDRPCHRLAAGQRGYFGTGLSDIIARAEAPKGSLYHYFPEGKPQIASAAIGFVADEVASFLDRAGTQAPMRATSSASSPRPCVAGWSIRVSKRPARCFPPA